MMNSQQIVLPMGSRAESEIFYDSKKHKTQSETRKSTKDESQDYINNLWKSEEILASDLVSVHNFQSTIILSPKFTFLEKFLQKRLERQIVKHLLDQKLLPSDVVKPNTYNLKLETLSNSQLDILSNTIINFQNNSNMNKNSEIPKDFMQLLELKIFKSNNQTINFASNFVFQEKPSKRLIPERILKQQIKNSQLQYLVKWKCYSENEATWESAETFQEIDSDLIEKYLNQQWKQFANWAYFFIGSKCQKQFHNHCKHLWTKINHAYKLTQENKLLENDNINETFKRHPQDKLYIAKETTEKVADKINLEGYHHVFNPHCFKNALGETVVDFFNFTDSQSVKDSQVAVEEYYRHTLENPSHQSQQFTKNFTEHFGAFTDSNIEPYTTANTASSHSKEHLECVQKLIQGLQPLSNEVNNYYCNTYPLYYCKMKKLDLGPNAPKCFGIFPTVGVNFNVISQFHRDLKDHPNSLCIVCPLGSFKGGELVFPELKLVIHAKQGQAIAFQSNSLVHGNLPVISGIRHSAVLYMHTTVIKQRRKFGKLFVNDKDTKITNNDTKPSPPKFKSQLRLTNSRRSHINLEPAKQGFPAQYKLINEKNSSNSKKRQHMDIS